MAFIKNLWRKLTHTRALDQSSGKLETIFFEPIYRVAYLTGLSTSDRNVLYLLYSNAVKLMIGFLVCGDVWYGFTETTSLDAVAASINLIAIQFNTIYRHRNMMQHKDFYKQLATSMNSPYFDISTQKRRNLVDYWSQMNETYLKLLLGLGNCTLAAWYIFPLVDEVEYNLIVGIRFPFYYKTPALYPLAYIIVVIAFTYVAHFVMVTALIMQTHLMHLLCQFTVLSDCFENLLSDCRAGFEDIPQNSLVNDPNFAARYLKRLGELVQQHKSILSHTKDMRSTMSGPMLAQMAASGTLICFVGYQATTTITENIAECLMSFLFLGYNAFELYIICRWCEEITIQSQKVGEAIYCSGWECGVSKLPGVRSTILIVMARANKPLYFTAGGMYNLTLTSYTTLVKTSYSALTVLLRFRHD